MGVTAYKMPEFPDTVPVYLISMCVDVTAGVNKYPECADIKVVYSPAEWPDFVPEWARFGYLEMTGAASARARALLEQIYRRNAPVPLGNLRRAMTCAEYLG